MDVTGAIWRKSSYSSGNGGNCVEVATAWRKSSYSSANGGDCIEVATGWHKSSYSSANGGACVEVARDIPSVVAVRDSKDPEGPKLAVTSTAWREFTGLLKDGRFDLT
jgi:hypothetical protein